ncbi:hypothetical protein QNJ95_22925 [Bradyrhizobium elkanii]|uniref:hypothetical protein n=1 Tax=Bradyrhizobium elkanii TaxID=29448 RepID=UPI002711E379|nr:hypothetical protein [Bradyrhizobium elkanii]WLA44130.1 hypothetical protein QNJ95_22925 [Bradyrhizobium elkanii]
MVAGPITFVAAKNVDTETGTESKLFFRLTCGEQVLADMGEEAARLFTMQVQQVFVREYDDEWTRSPTYAAAMAAFRAAGRRQSNEADEAPAVSTEQHRFA